MQRCTITHQQRCGGFARAVDHVLLAELLLALRVAGWTPLQGEQQLHSHVPYQREHPCPTTLANRTGPDQILTSQACRVQESPASVMEHHHLVAHTSLPVNHACAKWVRPYQPVRPVSSACTLNGVGSPCVFDTATMTPCLHARALEIKHTHQQVAK